MNDSQYTWFLRVLTFAVWMLAGLAAVFWGLRLSAAPPTTVARVAAAPVAAPDAASLARALGATEVVAAPLVAVASRYSLVGVIADRSRYGAALIQVQGSPAKPYRVGSLVDEGLVLQSVGPRTASLGRSLGVPAAVVLEMPQFKR